MKEDKTANKPPVIFDTNIFGDLLDVKLESQILSIISNIRNDYEITTSQITYYETIKRGKKDIHRILEFLNLFRVYEIDNELLGIAALFYCLNIRDCGDTIIAATALKNNTYILTSNQRDFPEPYFHELKHWTIHLKDNGNRTITHLVYLLSVDIKACERGMNKIDLFIQ